MVPSPVIRALDTTHVLLPCPHTYVGSASGGALVLGPAGEIPHCVMLWYPGPNSGDHKIAGSVTNSSTPVVQGGHKLGKLLPHLQFGPAADNALTAVHILFSQREIKFQNGEVCAQGSAIASSLHLAMPGLACSDVVSIPAVVSYTSLINSVWHWTSVTDVIAGWVEIGFTMLIEYAVHKIGQAAGDPPGVTPPSRQRVILDALRPSVGGVLSGTAGSFFSSLAGAAVRTHFDYGGDIVYGVEIGLGPLGSWKLERQSGADGSRSVTSQLTNPLGLGSFTRRSGTDSRGNRVEQLSRRVLNRTETESATRSGGRDEWSTQRSVSDGLRSQPVRSTEPGQPDWL